MTDLAADIRWTRKWNMQNWNPLARTIRPCALRPKNTRSVFAIDRFISSGKITGSRRRLAVHRRPKLRIVHLLAIARCIFGASDEDREERNDKTAKATSRNVASLNPIET